VVWGFKCLRARTQLLDPGGKLAGHVGGAGGAGVERWRDADAQVQDGLLSPRLVVVW